MKMKRAQSDFGRQSAEIRLFGMVAVQIPDDFGDAFVIIHALTLAHRRADSHPLLAVFPEKIFQAVLSPEIYARELSFRSRNEIVCRLRQGETPALARRGNITGVIPGFELGTPVPTGV